MNYNKLIKDSSFIELWKKDMITTLKQAHPEWDESDMDKVLNTMLKEQLQVPEVTMRNNYTGETRDSNMISVFDWAIDRKPIIAGNATFYKNQNEAINPIAKMLDDLLLSRKATKKLMFKVEDKTSDRYKDLDRLQLNYKILANSYYGGSGMPKSAFYSEYSGPATTGTAQSVISTTKTLFESFLVDNYKFIDINEAFHYMNKILKQDTKLPDFVIEVSEYDLFDRIKGMFYDDVYKDEYEEVLMLYISNLSKHDITRIYYKNNLVEFTRRHNKILNLYDKLFSSVKNYEHAKTLSDIPIDLACKFSGDTDSDIVKAYNSFVNNQYFMDPNSPPDTIIDTLDTLKDYYMDIVYMPFMAVDRIHRLKYFKRKTVCIVDTDSNILALDRIVEFFREEVLTSDYGRDYEKNTFIIINTLAYFITNTVAHTLNEYGKHSNIPKEHRFRFSMKNEFYFNKLIVGRKKKRYISSIKLREGNLLEPYKQDIKGFDYMKSGTSEKAKSVFDTIVKTRILESEIPDIPGILSDLKDFENEIRQSIISGELTYLPLGSAKDLKAYKDPYSQQGVRGAVAWNAIYPDRAIDFPSKVSILKLNIFRLEDCEDLAKTHPEIYARIQNEIFNSSIPEIASKGLQVLAIPSNATIPDWCFPYIDINTVINNIVSQFKGVLDTFGVNCPEVGKTIKTVNRKTKKFSNIVRF